MHAEAFRHFLCNSCSTVSPAEDPDEQANLLNCPRQICTTAYTHSEDVETRDTLSRTKVSKMNVEADRRKFRTACRIAHSPITKSQSAHVCDEVQSASSNPRLLWKTINHLLHPSTGNTSSLTHSIFGVGLTSRGHAVGPSCLGNSYKHS